MAKEGRKRGFGGGRDRCGDNLGQGEQKRTKIFL